MSHHPARTIVVMGLALLAGVVAVGLSLGSIVQGERRVDDVTEARDAELTRTRADLNAQRQINAEQSLLIDELLVATTPEARAEAVERSRVRREATAPPTTPPRAENRRTDSPERPANDSPGTTTPPNTTTTTAPPPPPEPDPAIGCIGPICI